MYVHACMCMHVCAYIFTTLCSPDSMFLIQQDIDRWQHVAVRDWTWSLAMQSPAVPRQIPARHPHGRPGEQHTGSLINYNSKLCILV